MKEDVDPSSPHPVQTDFAIHGLFPGYYDGTRVSYSFRSLMNSMRAPEVPVHAYVLGNGAGTRGEVSALLPMTLYRHTSRLVRHPSRALVRRFQHRFSPGDVAYMWLHNPPAVYRGLQQRGMVVVREMVNCTFARCRTELARAYADLGSHDPAAATDASIDLERNELLAADAVFCPNDLVVESVLAYGVAPERCLKTSYGWSPERLQGTSRLVARSTGVTFLFAGTGTVRKGLPWLLAAWALADTRGRLLIAGDIDPAIRASHAHILSRDDVIQLGHVDDMGAVYRSADVFCFPTWEEGGPMVTIEAMGMGLACIVTPMGGSGILSERSGGALMVAAGDTGAIAKAMQVLAANAALTARLGAESLALADSFTWARVGARRTQALRLLRREALARRASSSPRAGSSSLQR